MALVSLRQLLDHAGEHAYGLPAFNVNNLEQMRAIMMAADKTDSPVIVQASAGARKYLWRTIFASSNPISHRRVATHPRGDAPRSWHKPGLPTLHSAWL